MSGFDSQLKHTVTVIRFTQGAEDDYGQPIRTETELATVRALIQPKPSRLGGGQFEEVTTHGAGAQVSDHTIYMRVMDINAADEIEADDAGVHTGKRFEIMLVKDAGGQNHHLELDCRLIEPAPEQGGS